MGSFFSCDILSPVSFLHTFNLTVKLKIIELNIIVFYSVTLIHFLDQLICDMATTTTVRPATQKDITLKGSCEVVTEYLCKYINVQIYSFN